MVILIVLEQIHELDDVRMLAHLEHLNLSSLLEHFDFGHVFLFDLLDSSFSILLFVRSKLDEAELTLAKGFLQSIVLRYVRVAHGLAKPFDPLQLILLLCEKHESRLVRWNSHSNREVVLYLLSLRLHAACFGSLRHLVGATPR